MDDGGRFPVMLRVTTRLTGGAASSSELLLLSVVVAVVLVVGGGTLGGAWEVEWEAECFSWEFRPITLGVSHSAAAPQG